MPATSPCPPRWLRRAVTLLALSAVLPGSAQLAVGNRAVGRVALRVWAGLLGTLGLLGLLALVSRETVLGLLVRPVVLRLVEVVVPLLGLAWAALLVDAWRLARPVRLRPPQRRWVAALAGVLLLAGAAPTVAAARYADAQYELVTSVFADGQVQTTDDRMNVLLLGGDAEDDRIGLRPDSITLASVDTVTGDAVLMGLPRNLQQARFPDGTPAAAQFPDGYPDMLNSVYLYGTEHPELFPGAADPGARAMEQIVAGTLGLPVHYHVLVDLGGFRDLVDALGGVTIDVERRVPIGGGTSPITGWIEPGVQRLDGYHALWYARSREGSTDYDRMARQRCVLAAIARQADPGTILRRFRAIAGTAQQIVRTTLPQAALPPLLELALRARDAGVRSVQFVPPRIVTADPDVELMRRMAAEALAEPAPWPLPGSGGTPAGGTGPRSVAGVDEASGGTAADDEPGAEGAPGSEGADDAAGADDAVDVGRVCGAV